MIQTKSKEKFNKITKITKSLEYLLGQSIKIKHWSTMIQGRQNC